MTQPNVKGLIKWLLSDRIDRLPFFGIGLGLLIVKYFVDRGVAVGIYGREWLVANYLSQEQVLLWFSANQEDRAFYVKMLLLALPFIAVGVRLTVSRLTAIGWPRALALLFFVPTINLMFFVALSVVPSCDSAKRSTKNNNNNLLLTKLCHLLPNATWMRALYVLLITGLLGIGLVMLSVQAFHIYGASLFVALPFSLGLFAAVLLGFESPKTKGQCFAIAMGSVTSVALGLFVAGWEGAICLLMAAPLWLAFAALGGFIGYCIQMHAREQRDISLVLVALVLAVPVLMGTEAIVQPEASIFSVSSEVDIDAPQALVWRNVIEFPPLDDPQEWLFKSGIAYPTSAEIDGVGRGAVRRCIFSTGAFEEPIHTWNEPRLLGFSVTKNPPPMREWSFFGQVHPPHLDGFMQSKAGEFDLSQLDHGGTHVIGTTWYQHHMWPESYWRIWSDFIIHRIHMRVLDHIRILSERG